MCGIFAYHGVRTDAAQLTLEALKKLEYRGYDSWGIAVQNPKSAKISIEKHTGKISQSKTSLKKGSYAIGHTRWATHGGVTEHNAHPHLSQSGTIAIVHNGIVENYREEKTTLLQKGYKFTSETDSELIAHLIEEHTKKMSFKDAVMQTMTEIRGSNAILALDGKTGDIVACRDGSPLIAGLGKDELIIASDVIAITPYTNRCVYLADGETIVFSNGNATGFHTKTKKTKKLKSETIEIKSFESDKQTYPHYMLKEIMDQILTIPRAFQIGQSKKQEIFSKIDNKELIFTGCGSAYNCCLVGVYLGANHGIKARAIPANEFNAFAKTIDDKTVVIAISQSGETIDTIETARLAKKKKSTLISVLNVSHSSLARISDIVIEIEAGPEVAVVSTKAFTAQAAVLLGIFEMNKTLQSFEKWLKDEALSQAFELAKKIQDKQDIYIIGKNLCVPIAYETALKIKEASYIHAEGFAAGELKHGVIALIENGTPCIVIDDGSATTDLDSSAIQLKSRGGYIVGISSSASPVYTIHIKIPDMKQATFLAAAIAGQLIGYALCLSRGADPDKPRNLAKSVTVR